MRTAKKFLQISLQKPYPLLIKKPFFTFARSLKTKKNASIEDSDYSEIKNNKENISFREEKLQKNSVPSSNLNIQSKSDKNQEKKIKEKTLNENKSQNIKSIDEICKSFKEEQTLEDLNNLIRFLNDLIQSKKYNSKARKTDINLKHNIFSDLLELKEVKETIALLKSNIHQMENKQFTKFMALLSKMDYYDSDLILHASTHILNKEMRLNTISISYMIWSLARFKIKKVELLDHLADSLIMNSEKINVKSQANIFWALSVLNYSKEKLTSTLEKLIIKDALNYDSTCINLIFGAYCNIGTPNFDVLDALASTILKKYNTLTFRNIANWLNYCAKLKYTNMNCFNIIERIVVKKTQNFELKQELKEIKEIEKLEKQIKNEIEQDNIVDSKETKNQEKSEKTQEETKKIDIENLEKNIDNNYELNLSKNDDDLTPYDASQILLSFCKLKIVKPELFEALEAAFVKMLPIANPASLAAFAFAHSFLCTEMQMKFYENKKFLLKRSVKNLKKYNQMFYELMIPFIKERINEFKFDEIYSILLSASRPLVKKRSICRDLIEISLNSLPLFQQKASKVPLEVAEKIIFQYFRTMTNFIYKEEQKTLIEDHFKKINVDIQMICVKYGYLVPQKYEIELEGEEDLNEKKDEKDLKIEKNEKTSIKSENENANEKEKEKEK